MEVLLAVATRVRRGAEPSFGRKLWCWPRLPSACRPPAVLGREQRLDPRLCQHRSQELKTTSPSSRRSRFLVKVVASHTGSSTPRPTNQRNSRSTRSAQPTAVRSGSSRRPAAAGRAAIAPAGSIPARTANTARRTLPKIRQRGIHHVSDHPQRMVSTDPFLKIDIAEQGSSHRVAAAHSHPVRLRRQRIMNAEFQATNFSSLLDQVDGRRCATGCRNGRNKRNGARARRRQTLRYFQRRGLGAGPARRVRGLPCSQRPRPVGVVARIPATTFRI